MKTRYRLLVLTMVSLATLTACSMKQVMATVGLGAVAAGGVAGYYYVEGDLEADKGKDIKIVYNACLLGLQDEGYDVKSKDVNDINGEITAEKKDDKVTIKLKKKEDGDTKVSIRVGTFGDEGKSKDLMEAIDKHL